MRPWDLDKVLIWIVLPYLMRQWRPDKQEYKEGDSEAYECYE